jgi:hypothetical protein
VGRRAIKLEGSKHAPLGVEDEFEPAIVRSIGPIGARRVLAVSAGRGSLIPTRAELHKGDARSAVNRIAVASLRPRTPVEHVEALGTRDRMRLIRALVDVNGLERNYERLYGTHLSFDERLLVALRCRHEEQVGDLRARLLAARARHDRIGARPDAYVMPQAREKEITAAAERMRQSLVAPMKTVEQITRLTDLSRHIGHLVGLTPGIDASRPTVKALGIGAIPTTTADVARVSKLIGALSGFTAAPRANGTVAALGIASSFRPSHALRLGAVAGFHPNVLKGAARWYRDPTVLGIENAMRFAARGRFLGMDVAGHIGGVGFDVRAAVGQIAGFDALTRPYKLGLAGALPELSCKGLLDRDITAQVLSAGHRLTMPPGLIEWAREGLASRIAAAVRARYRRELYGIVLEVESDLSLMEFDELEQIALEEAVFAALEHMAADPYLPRRLRAIADSAGVYYRAVPARMQGGLEHLHRAITATDEAEREDEWVTAQTLLIAAAESMLFSELEFTGRAQPKGGKLVLVGTNTKLPSVQPVAHALLTGTEHEHLLEAIAPLLWKHDGAAFRHHRSWVGEVRSMTLKLVLALVNLLARHQREAIVDVLIDELGPLSPTAVPTIDGVATVIE